MTKVSFRDIDFGSEVDCALLANWFNQDATALSLSGPQAKDTAESVRETYQKPTAGFGAFFLSVDGEPVG